MTKKDSFRCTECGYENDFENEPTTCPQCHSEKIIPLEEWFNAEKGEDESMISIEGPYYCNTCGDVLEYDNDWYCPFCSPEDHYSTIAECYGCGKLFAASPIAYKIAGKNAITDDFDFRCKECRGSQQGWWFATIVDRDGYRLHHKYIGTTELRRLFPNKERLIKRIVKRAKEIKKIYE